MRYDVGKDEFCSALDVTATAGATISSDTIKIGTIKNYLGSTDYQQLNELGNLYLNVVANTAIVAAADSATWTLRLMTDSDATFGNGTELARKVITVPLAGVAAGLLWQIPLPVGDVYLDHLGVDFTPTVQNISSGTVTAFITVGKESFKKS